MIKVGYYPESHMTGNISNQFTNDISVQPHFDKHFVNLIKYAYCHSSFGFVAILAYPIHDISRYLSDNVYLLTHTDVMLERLHDHHQITILLHYCELILSLTLALLCVHEEVCLNCLIIKFVSSFECLKTSY